MCSVKKPKTTTTTEKEPTVIRNLYLDGVDPATRANRAGRSALRITPSAARITTGAPSAASTASISPAPTLTTAPVTQPVASVAPVSTADKLNEIMDGKSGAKGVAAAWKNVAALKKARKTNPRAMLKDVA